MTDLLKLAERVEAGDRTNDLLIADALKGAAATQGELKQINMALNGSLDAAKALHDAVLPGWVYEISSPRATLKALVTVYAENQLNVAARGKAPTPAAAWVAAILRAKESMP